MDEYDLLEIWKETTSDVIRTIDEQGKLIDQI